MNPQEIGQKLKALRVALNISMENVAAELRITVPSVAAIESGSRELSFPEFQKIAAAYGYRLQSLVGSSFATWETGPAAPSCLPPKIRQYVPD